MNMKVCKIYAVCIYTYYLYKQSVHNDYYYDLCFNFEFISQEAFFNLF